MYQAAIFFGALALASGFITIAFLLPTRRFKVADPPLEQYKALDESRKTYVTIFGGAAVIFTFAWTFFKDSETLEQARQQNANQEFIASSSLLSSQDTAVRAAGIFSLGRVAHTRSEYHIPVRETLTAFLLNAEIEHQCDIEEEHPESKADIKATVQVLADRDRRRDLARRPLDLSSRTFVLTSFFESQNFDDTLFFGTILFGSDFRGVSLRNAHFEGACAADWLAVGSQHRTSLADIRGTWRYNRYIVDFSNADLTGATFRDAKISGAQFRGANVTRVDFSLADISRADFTGATHFDEADFGSSAEKACGADGYLDDKGHLIPLQPCGARQ